MQQRLKRQSLEPYLVNVEGVFRMCKQGVVAISNSGESAAKVIQNCKQSFGNPNQMQKIVKMEGFTPFVPGEITINAQRTIVRFRVLARFLLCSDLAGKYDASDLVSEGFFQCCNMQVQLV